MDQETEQVTQAGAAALIREVQDRGGTDKKPQGSVIIMDHRASKPFLPILVR